MAVSGTERPERGWPPARLIPVAGMKGAKEQEQRATSALLAVMQVVPSFGKAVLRHLDAPSGQISCYVEPRFKGDTGEDHPDGAVIVERGTTRWVCLLEVKTGSSELGKEQVERYLRVASKEHLNALLTVSNEIVSDPARAVPVDGRLLKKLTLRHLPWYRILTEAVVERDHRGVQDPEQAKVLDDLVAYLTDGRSGAASYFDMGREWVKVRDDARLGLLSPASQGIREVADHWLQFLEYLSLQFRQQLGCSVSPVHERGDLKTQTQAHVKSLGEEGRLEGAIKVHDSVGPIGIRVNLRDGRVTTYLRVPSPKDGRPRTKINWLLRQLQNPPPDLGVQAHYPYGHNSGRLPIREAQAEPDRLLNTAEPTRSPSHFTLALTRSMGKRRRKDVGSFSKDTTSQAVGFYGVVVQQIRIKKTVRPPQLPQDALEPPDQGAEAPGRSPGDVGSPLPERVSPPEID